MQILFLFKIMYHAPPLKELFIPNITQYSLRNSNHLKIIRFNKSCGQNSFSYWAPSLFNKLIQQFPDSFTYQSIYAFKKKIQIMLTHPEQLL